MLNIVNDFSFSQFLKNDDQGFYNQIDYIEKTQRDLSSKSLMPPTYVQDTEYKIVRFIKQLFSVVIFPVGIYNGLHVLAAKLGVLPSSNPSLLGYPDSYANYQRTSVNLAEDWKYKRITIETDGYQIDAMIVGKMDSLTNGRWTLFSNGNGVFYEDELHSREFYELLTETESNGIVFNYPGVCASSGFPCRRAMIKSYHAMLAFLEDQERGIGAQEIIGFGHSIGGGVQGDALRTHQLKDNIRYVFVKSRTFYELTAVVSGLSKYLASIIGFLGWNINPAASSVVLTAPEIVLQTASVNSYEELKDSSKILTDGVIPAEASLGKHLLDSRKDFSNKKIIGIPETHNAPLNNVPDLAKIIKKYLY